MAEQALGLWVEAESHLAKALGHERDSWITKNRAVLESALATIRAHVGTLEIWGGPAGAEVLVDGNVVGRLPSVGPVGFASEHVSMQVRSPGYVELSRTLTIVMGSATREHVDLRRTPPPAAKVAVAKEPGAVESSAASSQPRPTTLRTEVSSRSPVAGTSGGARLPLVLGTTGLSAAALAFAIVEHVGWRNKVDSFAAMTCDADLPDRGGVTCGQLYHDGSRARTLAFVGYGVAGVLAAASLILYVTRPDGVSAAVGEGQVACSLSPTPRTLTCALRF